MTEHLPAEKKLFFLRFFSRSYSFSGAGVTLLPLGPIWLASFIYAAAADMSDWLPELLISYELLLSADTLATSYASSNLIVPLSSVLAFFVYPTVTL